MGNSYRWRIAIPFISLVVISMFGLEIYLANYITYTYQEDWHIHLLYQARLVANEVALDFKANPNGSLDVQAQHFANLFNSRVTLIATNGVVVGESAVDQASMENHYSRPEVAQALNNHEAYDIRFSDTLKMEMLYVAVPVVDKQQVIGVARLSVPLGLLQSNLADMRRTLLIITLIAILIAFGFAAFIANYTVRPLIQLMRSAEQIQQGETKGLLLPDRQDEIGQLSFALNQMAYQLRSQIDALQMEKAKLSSVLTQMTDGVIIADAEGGVTLINPAAERLFHLKENTSYGRSVVEVIRHHQLVEIWRKCLATKEQQNTAMEITSERIFIQAIAISLENSLPGSILLIFQDLTRLRRMELVRRDFISNVSHELRTPLASLKALVETLQEGALDDPPAARRFLSRMDTEIDTLTQLVRELLELSRIESGKVPLQLKAITPRLLLTPAVERMKLQAERGGLTLRLNCPEDLPQVMADPDRMEQVLVNLLHNAVKFTLPGGEIIVSAYPDSKEVIFYVKDTGVGISDDDLGRIFERFYKADRARSGGGTGLGLSIARHMVEAHGGRIWAESELGHGSCFYFSLKIS
jgi:two-component system phosphate regulon sensor histidine kinase PhoR